MKSFVFLRVIYDVNCKFKISAAHEELALKYLSLSK